MKTRSATAAVLVLAAALLSGCDDSSASPAAASASAAPAASAPAVASTVQAPPAPPASTAAAPEPPPTSVAAQHILVAYKGAKGAPKTVTRSKADARKRAEEVLAKIKGGGDFTELVKTYSDDPAAADRMGSVGKFTRDKMDKAFSDAAFALKVDEVSGVVETPFGFHVIKRNQ